MTQPRTDAPRVLIVDDEPKICQFLEVLLRREGYSVSSVSNAADALLVVDKGACDLLITDLKMPGMDGFGLVSRLKAVRPDLPIVMITGYATVENAVKALRYGVDDYVTKPFNIEELRKVVSRALRGAEMERQNRELMERLREANAELARHKALLAQRVQKTAQELKRTHALVREQEERLTALNRLGEVIAGERELTPLLSSVMETLAERTGAAGVAILLREGDDLVVRARDGSDPQPLGGRQPLHQGPAGQAALTQQPLLLWGAGAAGQEPAPGQPHRGPSVICVPVLRRGGVLGVIRLTDRPGERYLDAGDLDFVTSVARHIAPALENALLYRSVEQRCLAVIETLVNTVEAKDPYLSGHSRRVAELAASLARASGATPDEIEVLHRAAVLHDIGKVGISDMVLDKPAELSPEERNLVRAHPLVGERIVGSLKFLEPARPLIRHHHERLDGRGYPDGLGGDDLPRLVRILSIADVFEAMTADRPYRPALSVEQAVAELRQAAGRQFDPELTALFCEQVVTRPPSE